MRVITEQWLKEQGNLEKTFTVPSNCILTPSAKEFLEQNGTNVLLNQKDEFTTHLNAETLVPKTHPRIALRGENDALQAQIIYTQLILQKTGFTRLAEDLDEVMRFLQLLIRHEVKDEPLRNWTLLNLSPAEIREHSHHPSKHYGQKHFIPDRSQGETVALLNILRTRVRQTELKALSAFPNGEREDLITAYNRLSSVFFILMIRVKAGYYKE